MIRYFKIAMPILKFEMVWKKWCWFWNLEFSKSALFFHSTSSAYRKRHRSSVIGVIGRFHCGIEVSNLKDEVQRWTSKAMQRFLSGLFEGSMLLWFGTVNVISDSKIIVRCKIWKGSYMRPASIMLNCIYSCVK